jgi:beta-lactamase regulating signal transducer with metallopeptidase domain
MTCLKGLFVFTCVFIVTQKIKNLPSKYKHFLWFFAICSFVLIPVIAAFTPTVKLDLFSLSREKGEVFKAITYLSSNKITDLNTANYFAASDPDLSQRILQTPRFRLYLPTLLLMLWICGVLISSLNIITGRIILSNLLNRALPIVSTKITLMLKELTESMGIKQKIKLLKSPQCKLPFTCRIFRPVIVLPNDIEGWQINRTRAVLIHELAHIRRMDYFTKLVSRIICSVYWFIPLIWIAYFNFFLEQEEICDSFVVNSGAKSDEYAGQLVDLARIKRKHVVLAGIFLLKGRKKVMEKRILNILRLKVSGSQNKLKRWWMITLIWLSSLLFFLVFNPAVSEKYEALYGVWSNEKYNVPTLMVRRSKAIYNPDGTFAVYKLTHDTKPRLFGKFVIKDSWTDSEGNIWILQDEYIGMYFPGKQVSSYSLIKISNSGDILETIWNSSVCGKVYNVYPEVFELDPNNSKYRLMYRQ